MRVIDRTNNRILDLRCRCNQCLAFGNCTFLSETGLRVLSNSPNTLFSSSSFPPVTQELTANMHCQNLPSLAFALTVLPSLISAQSDTSLPTSDAGLVSSPSPSRYQSLGSSFLPLLGLTQPVTRPIRGRLLPRRRLHDQPPKQPVRGRGILFLERRRLDRHLFRR